MTESHLAVLSSLHVFPASPRLSVSGLVGPGPSRGCSCSGCSVLRRSDGGLLRGPGHHGLLGPRAGAPAQEPGRPVAWPRAGHGGLAGGHGGREGGGGGEPSVVSASRTTSRASSGSGPATLEVAYQPPASLVESGGHQGWVHRQSTQSHPSHPSHGAASASLTRPGETWGETTG